jgi:hypothetical protein
VRPIYRTGTPLPSKHPILYIFLTNICTEFFKNAAHTLFFPLQNAVYVIMPPFFDTCIIRILHTGCAKIQMPNFGAERLILLFYLKHLYMLRALLAHHQEIL